MFVLIRMLLSLFRSINAQQSQHAKPSPRGKHGNFGEAEGRHKPIGSYFGIGAIREGAEEPSPLPPKTRVLPNIFYSVRVQSENTL